jgi:hypothetical protein
MIIVDARNAAMGPGHLGEEFGALVIMKKCSIAQKRNVAKQRINAIHWDALILFSDE